MVTLRIQHSVPSFDAWKRAFDADPVDRKGGSVRRYSIHRSVSDPNFVMIDLGFEARFRVPSGGGRPTDPAWTERRLLPLAPKTLKKLEQISAKVRKQGMNVEPMQLAALLIEKTTERLSEEEAEDLARPKRRASR